VQPPKGWVTFRQILQVHHAAEDDDLWPVLRRHLTDGQDLHQLDLMVAEHRDLEAAIEAVDAALSGNGGVRPAPWRGVRGDAGRGPLFEAADRGEQALLAMRSSPDPRARASTRCSNSTRSGMRRRWQPNGWSGVELAALGSSAVNSARWIPATMMGWQAWASSSVTTRREPL
jgi:hypothetical protein